MAESLREYGPFLDPHRILVFNYKAATLYFGAGSYEICIDYLKKIIDQPADYMRSDLQCYARLLHLIAHYELGNFDIIDSLTRSVYRYMARMENLTIIEEEMFKFLRKTFYVKATVIKNEFGAFLKTIKQYEKDRFETRAFAYLDIVSWVESKVYGKTLGQVLQEKYRNSPHR